MKIETSWKLFGAALVLLLTLPCALRAGNRSGTVSEEFLKLSTDARGVGIGGALVAVAEGPTSIAFNPAGMMSVDDYGVAATYTAWFANIQHSFTGIVKNIQGFGAIGASVTILSTDDIAETTPQFPEGTGRYFRASDFAFSLAYARQVTDQFKVGVNGKFIQSYLFNTELGASSFAFDIGTLYDIPILRSHIGVSLTNIGKDVQFINETYSLPTSLRFGVLFDVLQDENNKLISTLQVTRVNDADEQYNLGAEYVFNDLLAFRGGWKFQYDQENLTLGFGLKFNLIGVNSKLDYGFNNFKYLPGTHTFTLDLQF